MGVIKEIGVKLKATSEGLEKYEKFAGTVSEIGRSVKMASKTQTTWSAEGKKTVTVIEKLTRAGEAYQEILTKVDKTAVSPAQKKLIKDRERRGKEAAKLKEKDANALTNLKARTKTYNKIGKEFNTNQAQTNKLLGASGLRVNKHGEVIDMAGKKVRNHTAMMRDNVGVLSKFQMEHLGVMFAGMALNRAMTNLNATSREWLGIGEMTSTMMGVTMLSANMDLLEYGIMPLFDALINLPPEAQKAIGYVSFTLEGLGAVMMVGGQLALGLDSTATLLSKIAGVSPTVIFKEEGLSALKNKLGPVFDNVKTMAKYGATAIAISFAVEDLKEGDMTGFIADVMMGAGFMTGNPWAIGIGISLKLATEGYLGEIAVDFFDTIGFMAEWGSDTLSKALSLRAGDIDWSGVTSFFDEMDEYAAQKVLSGEAKSSALLNRVGGVQGALDTLTIAQAESIQGLQDKYDSGIIPSQEELNKQIDEKISKYNIINTVSLPKTHKGYDGIYDRGSNILGNLDSIITKMSYVLPGGRMSFVIDKAQEYLGIKATGGRVHKTGGYYLHEGEEVVSKSDVSSEQIIVNATYNVTVSDKREFEAMLRQNNNQLTADMRKMSKI